MGASQRRGRSAVLTGWRPWLIAAASFAIAGSSCTLLVGTFESTGATGGPGGASGTNTTNTTGSRMTSSTTMGPGTGGATTSGPGGGGMGGCMTIANCPSAPNVCVLPECTDGMCTTQNVQAMVLMMDPSGNCQDIACDGMGHVTHPVDVNNPPISTNPCLLDFCDPDGAVDTMPQPMGMTCSDAMGDKVCNSTGTCVQCLTNGDCMSGDSCSLTDNTCVPASCSNGVQDNGETDLDCGGPNCSGCADFKNCMVGSDCIDRICNNGTCSVATCTDGAANGAETDVDCGGGTCSPCGPGLKCLVSSDCKGNQCAGTCIANCMDAVKNNDETDVDCGGSCPNGCAVGQRCQGDADCASTACNVNTSLCVASQCSDNQKDGNETDTDCGGGCPGCANGKNCKFDTDCASSACDFQLLVCVMSQCADHGLDGMETDVDCGGPSCGACATGKKCKVDTDCMPGAGCDSTTKKCDASSCTDGHKDGTETDLDCGGSCPACATGKICHQNSDCLSAACDLVQTKCVTSTCVDERQDGTESDIDCGGSCPGCATGQKCNSNADCTNSACDMSTGKCAAAQCVDEHQDGAETDVDCGGGTCPACAVGLHCNSNLDCVAPQACDGMTSVCDSNQCLDHKTDGVETDVDCGGANSCLRCGSGKFCLQNTDCQAGHTCSGVTHTCS